MTRFIRVVTFGRRCTEVLASCKEIEPRERRAVTVENGGSGVTFRGLKRPAMTALRNVS
jgi:hypothetical protein